MAAREPHRRGIYARLFATGLALFYSIALTSTARAQYIYLDANGDGFNTTADVLNPSGTTTIDVWLRTNAMRDGSQGICSSDDGELSLRSYELVLRAQGGTLTWGSYTNRIAEFTSTVGAQYDATEYHNGFFGPDSLLPGTYLLGTLVVSVASGNPSLVPAAQTSLSSSFHTAFGSACSGLDYDNVLKLGLDWAAADGAGPGTPLAQTVTLAQPANMTLVEGETADQSLGATDLDGLPVSFSLASGPPFATVTTVVAGTGAATGRIHLAPGYSDAGVTRTAVTASDGVASDTKTFIVTVQEGDRAPVLTQPADMNLAEGLVKNSTLFASDADDDPVTFFKVSGPDYLTVITVDPTLKLGLLVFSPGFGDAGTTTAVVAATDGRLTDTKSFAISVRDVDRPPVLEVPPDESLAEGALLRFDVTATDPDMDMIILAASGMPPGASFHDGGEGTGSFLWVPGFDQAGNYGVTFTATDMPGLSVSEAVSITVADVTQAVAIAQPLDMALLEGTVAEQTLRAMDQSGDPLEFAKVSGPAYMNVTTVVAGAGFAEGSVRLAPLFSDAGARTATVAVSDGVNRDEKSFQIVVADAGPGPDQGGPPFLPPLTSIPVGKTPHTVTMADVNRDGHLDLVTTGLGDNTVSVNLGDGRGSFGPRTSYPTGVKPHTVALSDLNRDGWLDMAVSNMGGNTVGVLLGLGDGTFGPMRAFPVAGSPMYLGIVDLDRNGDPDIVVTDLTNGMLLVLMGLGDGTLAAPATYPTGARCHGLAIGDFNRDGIPDVVTANPGPFTLSVLLGNGDGTLTSKGDLHTSAPHIVTVGDLNGDGAPDLAVANFDSATVSVLLGHGDGTFGSPTDLFTGAGAHGAAIADLNRDGHADLIAANQTSSTDSYFMGRGDGTFGPKTDFTDGSGAHSIAIGDLNEDGGADVAVSNIFSNTVTLFFNRFPPPANHAPTADAGGPYAGAPGVPVAFDGTGSSDPEGDALTFAWNFGDGSSGTSATPSHAYATAAVYRVSLTVSDRSAASSDTTIATIQGVLPARAFLFGPNKSIPLAGPSKEFPRIQLEPVEGNYANGDVLLSTVTLTLEGVGQPEPIHADAAKSVVADDRDRNGIEEIALSFSKDEIRRALRDLSSGPHLVRASILGALSSGARIRGALDLGVVVNGAALHAAVSPNPLNPEAVLTFETSRPGRLRVRLFDLRGRLVRTLLEEERAAAGQHTVRIDGLGASGARLASGVYFYRVEALEGSSEGRFAILR